MNFCDELWAPPHKLSNSFYTISGVFRIAIEALCAKTNAKRLIRLNDGVGLDAKRALIWAFAEISRNHANMHNGANLRRGIGCRRRADVAMAAAAAPTAAAIIRTTDNEEAEGASTNSNSTPIPATPTTPNVTTTRAIEGGSIGFCHGTAVRLGVPLQHAASWSLAEAVAAVIVKLAGGGRSFEIRE